MEQELTKVCRLCGLPKYISLFAKKADTLDKLQSYCKPCVAKKVRERLQNDPIAREAALARTRVWRVNNKELNKNIVDAWKKANPLSCQLANAKSNAKKANVPFDLTLEDIIIPELCPILKIPMVRAEGYPTDFSPSVDRIIPKIGYVKGNIQIISFLANKMKNSADFSQLRLFAEWVLENIPKEQENGN